MAQVFRPGTVLFIKLGFLAALVAVVVATTLFRWGSGYPDALVAPVVQPIPFSHKHHVGDDGIDCRYCHTSVEKSAFAGMPSTDTCLTCHSQLFKDAAVLAPLQESLASGKPIRWPRVYDLPDFVYFDHSIHVNKGVACRECHGRVDQMPLMQRTASLEMQWCLECHRNPEEHIGPLDRVFLMAQVAPPSRAEARQLARTLRIENRRRLTDCSTCHR